MDKLRLISFNFQVFGKVQGVFFRRDTKEKADSLGLVGWVKNQQDGTVIGVAQGKENICKEMEHWLTKIGSKKSIIEKMIKTDERAIDKLEFNSFQVIKK